MDIVSPLPHDSERPYVEWKYRVAEVTYLPTPDRLSGESVFKVLERRKSQRKFGELSIVDLATILWFTGKAHELQVGDSPRWQHRVPPSAGGKHPIDTLICNWPAASTDIYAYDSLAHALWRLEPHHASAIPHLIDAAAEVIGNPPGAILWHAAQFARTTSKYAFGESLVWRDAGVLTAYTTLIATALDLACCPLGITGEPHISFALGSGSHVVGVGGCVIGTACTL